MSKENTTAWALLVVSDPGQADTLVDQQAWAKSAATERKWTITEVFSGVSSGKVGARDLTLRMMRQLEATDAAVRPSRILMIRLERLGRGDGTEAMATFLRLRALNVIVHTRLDGDVTYGRASELLMPMIRLLVGGMENEIRRDKLCSMYARLRAARQDDPGIAISMNPPYGLAYAGGYLVSKPAEAEAVRLAFEMKGQGYGSHLIGKHLTLVAPPLTLKSGEQRPQHWTPDRVARMIAKTTYRGTIVDEATWARAQEPARVVSRPTMRQEYPLGCALTCACGRALVGATGSPRRGETVRFYQCRDLRHHSGKSRSHRAAGIEAQFAAILDRLTAEDALLESYARAKSKESKSAEMLDLRLVDLRSTLSRFDDRRRAVYEALEDGALTRDQLQWRLSDLTRLECEVQNQIEGVERERDIALKQTTELADLRQIVRFAKRAWRDGAIEDRRALSKAIANAFGGLTVELDGSLHVGIERGSERLDGANDTTAIVPPDDPDRPTEELKKPAPVRPHPRRPGDRKSRSNR